MSRNSPFLAAGRPMGSSTSGSSYHNDDDCYVDVDLVEKLERKRNFVMQVMNKAEEKQFKLEKWLVDIKHALYDANALLDKIDTEKRFRKKYKEDGSPSYSISEFVQLATSEINRIIKKLEDMVKDAAANMGLTALDEGAAASAQQTRIPNDRVTSSVLSKSTIVYGREEEKERILEQVLSSPAAPGNKPEVIAIVGMGGLGKTTLAQYVYNHADVERCFTRSRSWACVSDNFDLSRVTRAILESLTGSTVGVCELASLQQQLQEQLTGKRFLVVLDDAWDSSWQNWEKLMAPFSTGEPGSKIILTTRDMRVAGVAPADHLFRLEPMSEDEAWSLFSCEVFRDDKLSQHPKLEAIGKDIVKKCGGSPLAIKTLSGLLRKERKEVEWQRVRASSLWERVQNDIAPALGLSYAYLPPHLKTCFAYCSLFPKDYPFSKEELVNLWVDEGFLQQPNDDRSIEDVGVASFEDLSSRSFFTDSHYYTEMYVMHDLIRDLAQMVFADFHLQLNVHKAVKECKKVRHVSFHNHSECSSSSILEDLNQAESLQTFMGQYERHPWLNQAPRWGLDDRILKNVLLQQLSLRVLCLRGARIRTLPYTISNLKQLRCLDVSYSDVEELPAFLCMLYNLRSLLCESCDQIKEFHYDMAAFVSLRHFTLSGRQLQNAPRNLSQLSRVKLEFYLPYSGDDRMNQGDGTDSSDLRDMKEGSVDFDMVDVANESGLHVIVNIDRSTFLFHTGLVKDAFIASDLLESLRPHRDVKEVRIEEFNGTEFPGWLVDRSYHNIERVELVNCWISSGLMPALGGLPSLKCLVLEGVRNVKKLGSELYNSTVPFGSLEELYFGGMNEWEEWEPSDDAPAGGICFFPRLQKLSMVSCPKLKGRLPSNLPSLKELVIDGCSSLLELNGCHRQLVDLRIIQCGFVDMRLGMFPYLERLTIEYCDSFECFPADDSLPTSLAYLKIRGFTRLKKLDVLWLRSLTNLEELMIYDCPLLESLGYSSDVDDCSSLRVLSVWGCVNLKTINGAWLRSFTSLEALHVADCSEFLALPEEGLPRSLTKLFLYDFKNIRQDWIVIQNLTSLEELAIFYCNELKVIPVKLPCSLKKLFLLGNHPDLKERCKRDTGPDWPNIAHVPDIEIEIEIGESRKLVQNYLVSTSMMVFDLHLWRLCFVTTEFNRGMKSN